MVMWAEGQPPVGGLYFHFSGMKVNKKGVLSVWNAPTEERPQPPVWKSPETLCWEDNNIVARSKNAKKKGLSTVVLALWPCLDSHTEALPN